MAARVSVYYLILAAAAALLVTVFPTIVDDLPLGGVGDIADYGSGSIYDLEEALLSADDEELDVAYPEGSDPGLQGKPAVDKEERAQDGARD